MSNTKAFPRSDVLGWPWQSHTSEQRVPEAVLPSISIVMPNFNYAQYIEAAIRSVLLQDYPKLEFIVIDGGSTDGSLAIIEKYASCISYFESESDNGQSNAINKGIKRATGEIVAFLNSDDMYKPGALHKIAGIFAREPDVQWLVGSAEILRGDGTVERLYKISPHRSVKNFVEGLWLPQPATFWRRELHTSLGYFDESLHYTMDQEWWARLAVAGKKPKIIESILASHRDHGANKTSGLHSIAETKERIQIITSYISKFAQEEAKQLKSTKAALEEYGICKELLAQNCSRFGRTWSMLGALKNRPRLLLNRMFWGLLFSS